MDSKPPVSSLCKFKETRSDLEPLRPASVIQIQVPSSSSFSIRPRQSRRVLRTPPTHQDEGSFRNQRLASFGSLFFGRSRRHPRNFLWRVLGEGKVLELRSADLSKSKQEAREASITLQLVFPGKLRHRCVALADSDEEDCIVVFTLTKGNELYTIHLRKDFFCHATASEVDPTKWCKVSKPATFSISTPHTLIAFSALQLAISLCDGRLLLLKRSKGDDGSRWQESTYGDGQWAATLRGLVPWRGSNAIKYDDAVLEQETPIALAVSPSGSHVLAVCLNHTLRIWDSRQATSVFSKDLLWKHREPHEIPRVMLTPDDSNALQVFQTDDAGEEDVYYVATFSPHDFGQFKFWAIRNEDYGEKGIRDLYPDFLLRPPDPDPSPDSKAIWKVTDFKIKGGQGQKRSEMWVLMRSSWRYVLYSLEFDILDLETLWPDQWVTMASETLCGKPLPQISDVDPQDATEKWLKFILNSRKYPEPVLETALGIYCSERSLALPNTKTSLEERICKAIASTVGSSTGENDLVSYHKLLHQEWTTLWQGIQDLDKLRWDVVSFEYDAPAEMPWIVFADGCAAIRTCDDIELKTQNSPSVLAENVGLIDYPSVELDPDKEPNLPDELAVIIQAATIFRKSFSHNLQQVYSSVLAEELWLDPSFSVPLRIQSFYDRCNFAEEIGGIPFEELTNALAPIGGFNDLETDKFVDILEELMHELPGVSSGLEHTVFGRRLLYNGTEEMLNIRETMLSDLLAFVVFVEMEIDRDEMPMEDFDAAQVYVRLIELLKQCHISQWLAENTHIDKHDSSNGDSSDDAPYKTSTILEDLFALDLKASYYGTQSQSQALTNNIKDLLQWPIGGNYKVPLDHIPVYIQTYLLANNDIDLASDFLKYQPSTAWSTYIKARLLLMQGQPSKAAMYFKKAAFKLSRPSSFQYHRDSHSLLTPMEALSFGNGLPTFYTHILNLFDQHSYPSQMAHFAHLALQLLPQTHSDQKTTLLTSLFQASLQTTDFSNAFSALTRHPNPETLLPSFISALLTTPNALPQLTSLPFPPTLHSQIETLLSSSSSSPKSHHNNNPKILAAWRLHHNDYRGAAAALLPQLQQATQAKSKRRTTDDNGIENEYLAVINLLACAGKDNGWVLGRDGGEDGKGKGGKRQVVTIGDVRVDYQKELDRRSVVESGRFGFGGVSGADEGEEMDVL